jgi:hypothetical protein
VNSGAALPAALRQMVLAASAEAAYIKYLERCQWQFSKTRIEHGATYESVR